MYNFKMTGTHFLRMKETNFNMRKYIFVIKNVNFIRLEARLFVLTNFAKYKTYDYYSTPYINKHFWYL